MRYFAYEEDGHVLIECVKKAGFRKPKEWIEIDPASLPSKELRSAWAIVDGEVIVDPAKEQAAQFEANRRKRAAEYPPIGDQLDALMKWLATEGEFTVPPELKSIAMTCMSVKAKYPVH